MKLINVFVLLFLVSCSSSSQNSCQLDDVLNDFLNTEIEYSIDKDFADLTTVLKNNITPYLGFIGKSKRKIDFVMTSIKLDSENSNQYITEGYTQIYSENIRPFIGTLSLVNQYQFSEKLDEDVSYSDSILKHGFSILSYELKEDIGFNSAGIFKGNLLVSWYKDATGNIHYDDTLDYIPSYANCYFFGNWFNNSSDEKLRTAWSHYRIPCSDDLDIGASEFSPNPKYYNQGWESYGNELIEHLNEVYAKIIDDDGFVNMRKEKNVNSEIILRIQSDELVTVLNAVDDWWFVSYNRTSGYIHKSRLKVLKNK